MSTCKRGAPKGNFNNFRHGFYSTRVRRQTPTGDDITDLKTLIDDIALLRVFTKRLVESFDPSASYTEIADILRILCLSSAAITRILRTHYLITGSDTILDPEIEAAINQVEAKLAGKALPPTNPAPIEKDADLPPSTPSTSGN